MGTRLLIRNARVLDVAAGDYIVGCSVLVEDGRITDVGSGVTASGADSLDAADRVVMPGLIDAHVHPMISSVHIGSLAAQPVTLLAQRARVALEGMLRRGFTTVRDACGADAGLVRAVEEGLINGPRLFASGRALSQTGGHGDSRTLADQCAGHTDQFSRIADGVDAVRLAARSELRAGAHQIKVMASGGVASPSDEIWTLQYSLEELRAAVEEAVARRTYVLAHAYTAEAVERAVMSGVKSIEHGNLIDAPTAALMARHGTFLVPTLVTYEQLRASGEDYGMPPDQLRKVGDVIDAGLDSVRLARAAGVKVGFGTDLLGELQVHQSDEFRIRSRGEDPIDIIRSATVVNAELVGLAQRAGVVAAGADADLVLVDGDPLGTVTHLAEPERVACVIRSGVVAFSRTG